MKRRALIPALLALSLLLTGCSALLAREYSQITPHNDAPTAEGDPSTLRADSYQELVNALLYFVETGTAEGTVRLYFDSEDTESDLEAACLEVVQEDPLGAYAVEFIKFRVSQVVTYSEADVYLTYRRTPEQVDSIVQATGTTAIRGELESALSAFSPECVLRISYFNEDEEFIRSLARQAYSASPATALGMPELDIALYPDSGRQRIVEILLTYPMEPEELERRRDALARELEVLSASLAGLSGDDLIFAAGRAVLSAGQYDPEGAAEADGLFRDGAANSEGLSLSFAALCLQVGIPCQVAQGEQEGQPHSWNVVRTEAGWRHLDLTGPAGEKLIPRSDLELSRLGYTWDADSLPACPPPSQEEG